MSEPAGRHAARIAACVRLAQALERDAPDAVAAELERLPELARDVRAWQERVRQEGWQLDSEEWLLGLLRLIRLAERGDPSKH